MSRSLSTVLVALASLLVLGCAAEISSTDQALNRFQIQGPEENDQKCFVRFSDFTHGDPRPPVDDIRGDLLPDQMIDEEPREDDWARMQTQYMVAIANLELGASASGPELDMIDAVEMALAQDDYEAGFGLMFALESFNGSRSIEVPCLMSPSELAVQ